jgi:CelD/BcsL family acetyltransferase involved in cellulose biosynthesis
MLLRDGAAAGIAMDDAPKFTESPIQIKKKIKMINRRERAAEVGTCMTSVKKNQFRVDNIT